MGKKLLIKNAAELVTCQGRAPKTGEAMADIGIINDLNSDDDSFEWYQIVESTRRACQCPQTNVIKN